MKLNLKSKWNKFKENFKPSNYIKLYIGIVFLLGVVFIAYLVLKHTGLLDKFNNISSVVEIIQSDYRILSILLYILIQMLQVLLLPIPAFVTTSAGYILFGNWWEPIIYSLAAIIPASIIGFMLGRLFGKPFVGWMVGKENMEKYLSKTQGKERPVFFTMFLLPFFPDDILCMVAGITPMSLKFFTIMQLVCRPPAVVGTILVTSFFGELKDVLFKNWWGYIVIGLAIIAVGSVLYLSYKYSEKIEKFTVAQLNKLSRVFHRRSKGTGAVKIRNYTRKDQASKIIKKNHANIEYDIKFAASEDIIPDSKKPKL